MTRAMPEQPVQRPGPVPDPAAGPEAGAVAASATALSARIARLAALPLLLAVAWASLSPRAPMLVALPNRSDLLVHAAMHGALALTFRLGFDGRLPLAVIALAAVGFEFGQRFVPGRSFDLADLAANATGAVLGLMLARLIISRELGMFRARNIPGGEG